MKRKHKSLLFLTLGVFSLTLTGCSFQDGLDWIKGLFGIKKDPLVIPTVDVTSLKVNLPELPTRNVGEIRSDDNYDYIDIYELSDFHGAVNFEEHSSSVYIGLPKLASFMDGKRSLNPGGTLLVSSGDMFQGSADSNLTRGYMVNYCMQYMGFDAMALGNHEFDWTDTWIKNNAELKYNTSSIPFLGANILKDGAIPSFLKKSTIVNRGEYKIGIIGVIGSELENSILKSCVEGYDFVKYGQIVSDEAARLKTEEGCNAVVLLAHEGADKIDIVTGVDAAFGGHAHDDKTSYHINCPVLATENYGKSVAHIALKFNKSDKTVAGADDEIIQMSSVASSLSEHADITKIMNEYAPEINKIKNIKLATSDANLKYNKALKNICTLSMYEAAYESAKTVSEIDESKIVIALHNVEGGIRDDIKAGDVTYGNVYKAFPFDNEIVLIKVTGKEFVDKIVNLRNLGCYKIFENRDYFNLEENYYIATTDYLALSEKEFGSFKKLEDKDLIRTGKVVRDVVANKIYQEGKVKNAKFDTYDSCYSQVPATF